MKEILDGLKDLVKFIEEQQKKMLTLNKTPEQIAHEIYALKNLKDSLREILKENIG